MFFKISFVEFEFALVKDLHLPFEGLNECFFLKNSLNLLGDRVREDFDVSENSVVFFDETEDSESEND